MLQQPIIYYQENMIKLKSFDDKINIYILYEIYLFYYFYIN